MLSHTLLFYSKQSHVCSVSIHIYSVFLSAAALPALFSRAAVAVANNRSQQCHVIMPAFNSIAMSFVTKSFLQACFLTSPYYSYFILFLLKCVPLLFSLLFIARYSALFLFHKTCYHFHAREEEKRASEKQ
jgi:hypothetical protein